MYSKITNRKINKSRRIKNGGMIRVAQGVGRKVFEKIGPEVQAKIGRKVEEIIQKYPEVEHVTRVAKEKTEELGREILLDRSKVKTERELSKIKKKEEPRRRVEEENIRIPEETNQEVKRNLRQSRRIRGLRSEYGPEIINKAARGNPLRPYRPRGRPQERSLPQSPKSKTNSSKTKKQVSFIRASNIISIANPTDFVETKYRTKKKSKSQVKKRRSASERRAQSRRREPSRRRSASERRRASLKRRSISRKKSTSRRRSTSRRSTSRRRTPVRRSVSRKARQTEEAQTDYKDIL